MYTILRAGALVVIAGAVAGLVLIFATDPVEAPRGEVKNPALESAATSTVI